MSHKRWSILFVEILGGTPFPSSCHGNLKMNLSHSKDSICNTLLKVPTWRHKCRLLTQRWERFHQGQADQHLYTVVRCWWLAFHPEMHQSIQWSRIVHLILVSEWECDLTQWMFCSLKSCDLGGKGRISSLWHIWAYWEFILHKWVYSKHTLGLIVTQSHAPHYHFLNWINKGLL